MKYFVYTVLLLVLQACSMFGNDSRSPDPLSLETMREVPDTLVIGEQQMVLTSSIWRDFMPISPPDGKPMIGVFYLTSVDESPLPADLRMRAAWIAKEDAVWASYMSDEPPPDDVPPYRLNGVVRGGPKWHPGIDLFGVVQITDSVGRVYLIRSAQTTLGATS